ncbi:MAG: tetratricopeptide repeat protein [Myxococcota bacterium]
MSIFLFRHRQFACLLAAALAGLPAYAYNLDPLEARLNSLEKQVKDLSLPYSERSLEGRLNQARFWFERHEYGKTLAILQPILRGNAKLSPVQQQDIFAMTAHSSFELGSYLEARGGFLKLNDKTSAIRLVQIADQLGDLNGLKAAYSKINEPPEFVRYIYARRLFINHQDLEARLELEKLENSAEYADRAKFILGASWARSGNLPKARALFSDLLKSTNLKIASLAKLALARTLYEEDKPKQAIEIYEEVHAPDELALAQMRAGDLSRDLNEAQKYYRQAEKSAVDQKILGQVLTRQDDTQNSRKITAALLANVTDMKKMIAAGDTYVLETPWMQTKPEIQRLAKIHVQLKNMEGEIAALQTAYDAFDVDSVDQLKSESALLERLTSELAPIREELTRYAGSEMAIKFESNKQANYTVKSISYELDGETLPNLDLRQIDVGEHQLKVALVYRHAGGDAPSMVDYRLNHTYTVQAGVGEVIELTLSFGPELSLKTKVVGTNLAQLRKLEEEASLLSSQLILRRAEEPFKLKDALVEAAGEVESLRSSLIRQSARYEEVRTKLLTDNAAVWTAELDERIRDSDESLVHSGIQKRQSLQNRLSQIEQTKAAELKRSSDGESQ